MDRNGSSISGPVFQACQNLGVACSYRSYSWSRSLGPVVPLHLQPQVFSASEVNTAQRFSGYGFLNFSGKQLTKMGTQPQQRCREEEEEEMPGRGTTLSGQSMSTSRSVGSPSSRSEQTMATPSSDNTCLRLNHLDIHGDDAGSQGAVAKKKKRGQRAVGGDKSGRGLRQFSMKVCEKVESKGRTTYNEVADELVAEFADPSNSVSSPDQQQYDEKNIRRRVYDALNVLMAMDIISKDKKEIQWKGLPRTSLNDIEELKTERLGLRNRIEKKAAYLQELEEQYIGLQHLIQRNEQLYSSGNVPNGVYLPFILVQTRPHATVELEISEDMQLVHFDFNSTPFELHDDSYVLKAMEFCPRLQNDNITHNPTEGGEGSSMSGLYQAQVPTLVSNPSVRLPSSPPLPGILKARVKNEH
ncbi:transcription factor-like protein DPB isoform X2 [Gastrolobium bilobum]|uniref:transcription factor-like protein DPB isoform X2 n=1 Tax=Gastrolobium bilobum TaxID=150636 RepID=UPI002AB3148F|nr:transcription factor-like protein DPB isoform X2 [Gastrolobium bilobum]